jgi:DNA-binding LacI/PurR family transcriptional regulator
MAFILSNRSMLHPFHSRILEGAAAACADGGWDMLFLMYRYHANLPWKNLHLPRPLQRRDMVRGLIVAGSNSPNLLDCLQHRGIPFVALGNNLTGDNNQRQFDAVFSDDIQGAHEMTRYLQTLRHRDIWFVGNTAEPWSRRCLQGYERAMREMGLACHASSLDSNDPKEVGYLGTKLIFSRGEQATAILCATDQIAQGVYKAATDLGLRIPQDISVAGCNDTLGPLLSPALSSIREFPEQLGKKMVELLLRRIDNADTPPRQVTIPIELVKRESCREFLPKGGRGEAQTIVAETT